jgi:hypothetical protein
MHWRIQTYITKVEGKRPSGRLNYRQRIILKCLLDRNMWNAPKGVMYGHIPITNMVCTFWISPWAHLEGHKKSAP